MKKLALLLLGIGLITFTSCQHKELETYSRHGNGNVNITVYASDAISVRSGEFTNSALGGGSNLSGYYLRYILAIYDANGAAAYGPETAVVSSGATTFSADLDEGENYTIVCWADYVTDQSGETDLHYDTSDLTAITYASGDDSFINDESRDAYYIAQAYTVDEGAVTLTLKRPFAKLRLVATDWEAASTKPTSISVTYSGGDRYNDFSALSGEATSAASTYTYTGTIDPDASYYTGGYDGSEYNYRTLYVDYILVNDETAIKLSYTTLNGTTELHSYDIQQDVPLVRNCLTTVIGKLLSATSEGDITVSIDDEFDHEYEVKIGTVSLPDGVTYTTVDGKSYPAVSVEGTLQLSASVSDIVTTSTDEDSWTWTSDSDLATVDQTGLVTGVTAGGPVVITASQYDDSSKLSAYATVTIYVIEEEEEPEEPTEPTEGGVAVEETSVVLSIDEDANTSGYSIAYSEPEGASQTLTWKSSDEDVVTVEDGVIKVVGFGSATVTVTSDATDLADEYAQSAEIAVSVPYGYYNDETQEVIAQYWSGQTSTTPAVGFEWDATSSCYKVTSTTISYDSGSWTKGSANIGHLTTNSHTTFGTDVSRNVWIDPTTYPIVCFRITLVSDSSDIESTNINLDTSAYLEADTAKENRLYGNFGGSNNKYTKYDLNDGTVAIYYDFSNGTFASGSGTFAEATKEITSLAFFETLQLKVADIQPSSTESYPTNASYNFYWFKTFASATDLESYLKEEGLYE